MNTKKKKNSLIKEVAFLDSFARRHIGPRDESIKSMLSSLGFKDMPSFIKSIVPREILTTSTLNLEPAATEEDALKKLDQIASKNKIFKSYIGQGYYNTFPPSVIVRNVLENPSWYTSYTPYQPEISQGRLEALINFQTLISDLTGLEISNASLLDEATAAAEAMALAKRVSSSKANKFFVDEQCFPQTIEVIKTRAKPLGIKINVGPISVSLKDEYFGAIIQYPGADGNLKNYSKEISALHKKKSITILATDLLALTLIKSPGELGADISVGSSQRFGVPMGFGGPHAAFISTKEEYKRFLPGRIVGASVDNHGNLAYRLALQTREQHIRREKATSNICTSQALLAIMAGFFAVYHGPEGLKRIASKVNERTSSLAQSLTSAGFKLKSNNFFDTLVLNTKGNTSKYLKIALAKKINLRKIDSNNLGISLDETVTQNELEELMSVFVKNVNSKEIQSCKPSIPNNLVRKSEYLKHQVFHNYQSETGLMRYIKNLHDKDIALDRAMIPLGSCTMKLNSASEMIPISWPKFSSIHPFAPKNQVKGYTQLIEELENMLAVITGYSKISVQPNAGSQGEYAGLLAIDAYHKSRNQPQRDICLIPNSAHGTNPASAQMSGMKVISINCDENGNIDLIDLEEKAQKYSNNLSAIMITYPSTHGVFEPTVIKVCEIIHKYGGQVYIDGANLNAMVGLCFPGKFGGDVSHLNLHKTFCIPHGGGGPGVGPIAVSNHLNEFLPGSHIENNSVVGPVSATNWGSASILPISWMYIKMMGPSGLKRASEVAILNANYMAKKLEKHYKVLYKGNRGLVAHECIIDIRHLKETAEIEVEDIAKRLIDYGFHAPTMSWPVAGTLMIEPTESESVEELDRFCDAMISIREEIEKIESGNLDKKDNMLKNAPHTALHISDDNWDHCYSRSEAAYPVESLKINKYWPPTGRVDNAYGDRNLMCTCLTVEEFEKINS